MFSAAFIKARDNGLAYSWSHSYDHDAADTILTVCNDHTGGWKLNIEKVDVGADTATEYTVHLPSYATWAGTSVTGTNLNADSSNTAIATATGDETGQASQGSIIANGFVGGNDTQQVEVNVKLGYHKAIGVDLVTAGTKGTVTFYGYYSAT